MHAESRMILDARIEQHHVAAVYQPIAAIYDLWGRLTESNARRRCLELAAIRDGEAVLEVAVGTGLAFQEILKANPHGRNEGIDLTAAMLAKAEQKARRTGLHNYRLRIGDAYRLDYPEHTFDVLINNFMFDLLPESDFNRVLQEFKRVLRPGGRLVMVNMALREHWYNWLWEGIYRINPAWVGGCRGVYLTPYLKAAGFTQLHREFMSQLTFPSEVVFGVVP